jgi:hypothetical protein
VGSAGPPLARVTPTAMRNQAAIIPGTLQMTVPVRSLYGCGFGRPRISLISRSAPCHCSTEHASEKSGASAKRAGNSNHLPSPVGSVRGAEPWMRHPRHCIWTTARQARSIGPVHDRSALLLRALRSATAMNCAHSLIPAPYSPIGHVIEYRKSRLPSALLPARLECATLAAIAVESTIESRAGPMSASVPKYRTDFLCVSWDTRRALCNDNSSHFKTTCKLGRLKRTRDEDVENAKHLARQRGQDASSAGWRRATGGQQFASDGRLLDVRSTHGVLTLGGAVAAHIHGRGLSCSSLLDDIEALEVVLADGTLVDRDRHRNRELFSLTVGGYGLLGVVTSAILRLVPRRRVQRVLALERMGNTIDHVEERIDDGHLYRALQFSTAPEYSGFLSRGVFSCFRPVDPATPIADNPICRSPADWRRL